MKTPVALGIALVAIVGWAAPATAEADSSGPNWDFERYMQEAHGLGDLKITVGPDSMVLDWAGIELGQEASEDLRIVADGALSGEKDGRVDRKEADDLTFALTALLENAFGKYANNHRFSGLVLIDDSEAQSAQVTHLEVQDLVGPVDQPAPLTASFTVGIPFPNVDEAKDVHAVRLDMGPYYIREGDDDQGARFAGDLTLTIAAADGWTLDQESVQPGCAADQYEDGTLVFAGDDVSCFTGHPGLLLSFAITGHGQSHRSFLPGFELPLLVAALALVGVLARRRN